MAQLNSPRTLVNIFENKVTSFLTTVLALLITFNLGWLLTFIRISSQINTIKNQGKAIFNLELLLLVGNFSIIILLVGFILTMEQFKLLFNKH